MADFSLQPTFLKGAPPEFEQAFSEWALVSNQAQKAFCKRLSVLAPNTNLQDVLDIDTPYYFAGDNLVAGLDKFMNLSPLEDEIFCLVAETRYVRQLRIAEALPKYIADLYEGDEDSFDNLKLALAEAILNATEHGNLELSGFKKSMVDDKAYFIKYYEQVEENINKEPYASRHIVVRCTQVGTNLVVFVQNEGKTFDYKKTLDLAIEPLTQSAHERGLRLMQKIVRGLQYDDGGRTLKFHVPLWQGQDISELLDGENVRDKGRILIVDDQMMNRQLAKHFLQQAGFKNIFEASGGRQGIEMVEELEPDLILLDILMPDMDGFTTCRQLKRRPSTAQIPVIFLSALTDNASRTKGFEIGAVDYINKPIEANEMVARCDVHIKNGMLVRQLQSYTNRVRSELVAAQRFQRDLLPTDDVVKEAERKHNVGINHLFQASTELAGDYWGLFETDDEDKLAIMLADFTGHGVVSALNTVRLHAVLVEFENLMLKPTELIKALNDRLKALLPPGQFATAMLGIYDRKEKTFTYCGHGHPPFGYVPANSRKKVKLCDCNGLPLGLVKSAELPEEVKTLQLEVGDELVFYSDALIENEHHHGSRWEEEGLTAVLQQARKDKDPDLHNYVRTHFMKSALKPLQDDLTLVTLKVCS